MPLHRNDGSPCFLVALEGPDRLGKSTQAKEMHRVFCEEGRSGLKASVVKIPYKDEYTYDRIYEMLFSMEAVSYPEVFQSFQALNRHIFQKDVLPKLVEENDVIILDRWNLSTEVYGAASGVSMGATLAMLKGIYPPDLTLVFTGSPFLMETEKDSYEANERFQEKVRAGYADAIARRPGVVEIHANRPKEVVTADLERNILGFVHTRLENR